MCFVNKLDEREEADFLFRYSELTESGKLDLLKTMIEMGLGACPVGAPEFDTFLKMVLLFESWSIKRIPVEVPNEEVHPPQAPVD